MIQYFDQEELVKATERFSPSRLLGKGSHGSVYRGVLHHEENSTTVVAVKKSTVGKDHVSRDNTKKLENEIHVLSSLLSEKNPYIINILGTSHHDSYQDSTGDKEKIISKLLVMEFMPNGSLHDLLHSSKSLPSWPKRVEIAVQVAKAIQFLHEGGKPTNNVVVIHRDIKSANVLFDSNWNAKLADFGLAVLRPVVDVDDSSPGHDHHCQPAGTIGYLDPCYTTPSKLSTKNDVFSYGVVLLEIISGQKVIDITRAPASIVEWAVPLINNNIGACSNVKQQQQRVMEICDTRVALPAFMEGTIRHLLCMAARCVSTKEENRPSMSEILAGLGQDCLVEPVIKAPSWTSLLRSFMLMKRRVPKFCKKRKKVKCAGEAHGGELTKGKLMLREILADITLK